MGAPWYEWDWDYVWHFLGGLVIEAPPLAAVILLNASILWIPVGIIGLAFFGIAREMYQHDIDLTAHQWLEAMLWPVGGLVALAAILPLLL